MNLLSFEKQTKNQTNNKNITTNKWINFKMTYKKDKIYISKK